MTFTNCSPSSANVAIGTTGSEGDAPESAWVGKGLKRLPNSSPANSQLPCRSRFQSDRLCMVDLLSFDGFVLLSLGEGTSVKAHHYSIRDRCATLLARAFCRTTCYRGAVATLDDIADGLLDDLYCNFRAKLAVQRGILRACQKIFDAGRLTDPTLPQCWPERPDA